MVLLSILDLWGQREMPGAVLAAKKKKKAWQEQAPSRLRITEGSGESTLPLTCGIVLLRDSAQHHQGEIQRENLSKTVGGSGRLRLDLRETLGF